MNATTRPLILAISALVLALILSALFTFWWVEHEQHQWCSVLVTLDNADHAAEKAPPAQRPHGAYSFELIKDFHNLRDQWCGS